MRFLHLRTSLIGALVIAGYVGYQYMLYKNVRTSFETLQTAFLRTSSPDETGEFSISFDCQHWLDNQSNLVDFLFLKNKPIVGLAQSYALKLGGSTPILTDYIEPTKMFIANGAVLTFSQNRLFFVEPRRFSMFFVKDGTADIENLSKVPVGLLVLLGYNMKPSFALIAGADHNTGALFLGEDFTLFCNKSQCNVLNSLNKIADSEESAQIIGRLPANDPVFKGAEVCSASKYLLEDEKLYKNPSLLSFCKLPEAKEPLQQSVANNFSTSKKLCADFESGILPVMNAYLKAHSAKP